MKNWMERTKKKFKNQKGLTLVELLAVIVILAIIGTIAFVMIGNVIENSRQDSHVANAQQAVSAAKLHEAQGGEFTTITSTDLYTEGLLDDLISPWGEDETNEYTATITRAAATAETDGVTYTVNFKGQNCTLSDADEADLATGRDACTEN